jgi:hypothetical protein
LRLVIGYRRASGQSGVDLNGRFAHGGYIGTSSLPRFDF